MINQSIIIFVICCFLAISSGFSHPEPISFNISSIESFNNFTLDQNYSIDHKIGCRKNKDHHRRHSKNHHDQFPPLSDSNSAQDQWSQPDDFRGGKKQYQHSFSNFQKHHSVWVLVLLILLKILFIAFITCIVVKCIFRCKRRRSERRALREQRVLEERNRLSENSQLFRGPPPPPQMPVHFYPQNMNNSNPSNFSYGVPLNPNTHQPYPSNYQINTMPQGQMFSPNQQMYPNMMQNPNLVYPQLNQFPQQVMMPQRMYEGRGDNMDQGHMNYPKI